VDSGDWSFEAEAEMGDGVPVSVLVAIPTDESSGRDGNRLAGCTAFDWGA
jgi:hypothetical protein